jgi:hypothetical protein
MKLSEYKKLEEKVKNNNFHKNYSNINKVMFGMSIFGHIASIFLAYFLLFKILSSAIIESTVVAMVSSIIMLLGLELLKREVFDKFSLGILKEKVLNKKVLPLLLVSLSLFSMSFYATINGAKEFSSKEKELEEVAEVNIDTYEDSVKTVYIGKIVEVESEIKFYKDKLDQKDKEQTDLASLPPTRQIRSRINDLKVERADLKSDIKSTEENLESVKSERDQVITEYKSKILGKTDERKKENKSNTLFFIALSTIIELLIVAGVYFNEYYKFRSYDEYRKKLEKDPNFQKWFLYNSVIEIIYTDDTQVNDKVDNIKNITTLCKLNGVNLLPKDVMDMFKIFSSLGIIKTSGSAKYYGKSKDLAIELLKKHFNME